MTIKGIKEKDRRAGIQILLTTVVKSSGWLWRRRAKQSRKPFADAQLLTQHPEDV